MTKRMKNRSPKRVARRRLFFDATVQPASRERHREASSRTEAALSGLISICIPTCNRPELLREALESCAAQEYDRLELVVGDDSSDDASRHVVEAFARTSPWHVSYVRNLPALGQNANVAALFARANGDRILLLHDDDRLLPGAVSALAAPWDAEPNLAITFGETGYRSDAEVGVYCDKDFSIRLGASLRPKQMVFVDVPVSQYRITRGAISQSSASRKIDHARSAIAIYEMLEGLGLPASCAEGKAFLIDHLIDKLIKGYATTGRRATALSLYRSSAYGWKRRLSPRGLYHAALILLPGIDRLRRYS